MPLETRQIVLGSLFLGATALYSAAVYWIKQPKWSAPAQSGTLRTGTLQVKSLKRTWRAYLPRDLKKGAPVLICFHGSTIDGETFRTWTCRAFEKLADERGFVVVYPDGLLKRWSDSVKNRGYKPELRAKIDEAAFVEQLIEELAEDGISTSDIYLLGYSNGGGLALDLTLSKPTRFKGAAVFCSQLPIDDNRLSKPPHRPLPPIFYCVGTKDPIVPYHGGEMKIAGLISRGFALSFEETRNELLTRNGLDSSKSSREERIACSESYPAASVKGIQRTLWQRDGKDALVSYIIEGGGHTVPRPGPRFGPRILGPTALGFDAPTAVVDFFGL